MTDSSVEMSAPFMVIAKKKINKTPNLVTAREQGIK